jgi:hypothetical protein
MVFATIHTPHVCGSATPLLKRLRSSWTLQRLRSVHPATAVDVSLISENVLKGTVDEHPTVRMEFARLLERIVEDGGEWRRRSSKLCIHLAQCSLSLLPSLRSEPPALPDLPADAPAESNIWLAVGPTRSALHYDAYVNVLGVVRGTKRLLLLPPAATRLLAPRAAHGLSANHSRLSDAEIDAVATTLGDSVVRLEVAAGEAVCIPAGWWHRVDSPDEARGSSTIARHTLAGLRRPPAGAQVTLAINWWWHDAATHALGGSALPPSYSAPAAPYVLRRAFGAAVRVEQRRRLLEEAGLPPPAADSGSEGGGGGCACSRGAAELAATGRAILAAAAQGDAALLRALLQAPAHDVLGGLAAAAASEPAATARLLTAGPERGGIGPAGACALSQRLEEAVRAPGPLLSLLAAVARVSLLLQVSDACPECARRAADHADAAINSLGDDATQQVFATHIHRSTCAQRSSVGVRAAQAARAALLRLEEQFCDAASARVLRDMLGLSADESGDARRAQPGVDAVDAVPKRQRLL